MPEWIEIDPESAAAVGPLSSFAPSPYFAAPDFYSMRSNDKGLTIIGEYPTYQQTKGYSCGPSAVLTILWHFGVTHYDEDTLVKLCGTLTKPNERGEGGTPTSGICRFFESIGWNVESSLYAPVRWNVESSLYAPVRNSVIFDSPASFRGYALEKLRAGIPIMVENICMGAHWRVLIGYDTMGTETVADDVLIFMDSSDTRDHCHDGYAVEHLARLLRPPRRPENTAVHSSVAEGTIKRSRFLKLATAPPRNA